MMKVPMTVEGAERLKAELQRLKSVERPAVIQAGALGAAFLAGLATGVWGGVSELAQVRRRDRLFEPQLPAAEREARFATWRRHLAAARDDGEG